MVHLKATGLVHHEVAGLVHHETNLVHHKTTNSVHCESTGTAQQWHLGGTMNAPAGNIERKLWGKLAGKLGWEILHVPRWCDPGVLSWYTARKLKVYLMQNTQCELLEH